MGIVRQETAYCIAGDSVKQPAIHAVCEVIWNRLNDNIGTRPEEDFTAKPCLQGHYTETAEVL